MTDGLPARAVAAPELGWGTAAAAGQAAADDPLNPDARPGPRRTSSAIPSPSARGICLRALTGAPKTRQQLADLLAARDVPEDAAETVLDRFTEVGLIDDAAFARAWVSSRQAGRGLARRALQRRAARQGCRRRGGGRGRRGGRRRRRAGDRPPAGRAQGARAMRRLDRATATRRLMGMLARKGYGGGLAAACRARGARRRRRGRRRRSPGSTTSTRTPCCPDAAVSGRSTGRPGPSVRASRRHRLSGGSGSSAPAVDQRCCRLAGRRRSALPGVRLVLQPLEQVRVVRLEGGALRADPRDLDEVVPRRRRGRRPLQRVAVAPRVVAQRQLPVLPRLHHVVEERDGRGAEDEARRSSRSCSAW